MSLQVDAVLTNTFYPLSADSVTSVSANAAGTTNLSSSPSIVAYAAPIASPTFTGVVTLPSLIESGTLSPTSAGTAGVTGQIAWDGSNIYVCTSGGSAGHATWKAAALTAV